MDNVHNTRMGLWAKPMRSVWRYPVSEKSRGEVHGQRHYPLHFKNIREGVPAPKEQKMVVLMSGVILITNSHIVRKWPLMAETWLGVLDPVFVNCGHFFWKSVNWHACDVNCVNFDHWKLCHFDLGRLTSWLFFLFAGVRKVVVYWDDISISSVPPRGRHTFF